ncbi:radical SAM protein [Candidatus Peregrinibacteria bacterium]|nr:radical SAM protein [Candidatus Peregrinibacteria bacterium]
MLKVSVLQSIVKDAFMEVVDRQEILSVLETLPRIFPDIDSSLLQSYATTLQYEKVVKFGGQHIINTFFPPFPSKAFENVFNRGLNYPMVTNVAVTNNCGRGCDYCSYSPSGGNPDLSLDQLKSIMGQLQDLRVPIIGITGGEPLLRPDLEEIIGSIDDRSSTILFTGGGLTLERARNLKNAGLFCMSVSLDHHSEKINDKRRFLGSHKAALQAIENSLAACLYTVSSIVVDGKNFEDLEEYIRYMGQVGVHGIRVSDVVPSGACIDQPPLSPAQKREIIEIHKRINANPFLPQLTTYSYIESEEMFGCGAGGVHHMFVDGEGKLRPCDFVPAVFGDLTKEPLREAYSRMRKVFERPRSACPMGECHEGMSRILAGRNVADGEEVEALLRETRGKCGLPCLYKA